MFPYIGTKKKELKFISPYFPWNIQHNENTINHVYELFGGSCAVSKFILCNSSNKISSSTINDILPVLIELYKIINAGKDEVEKFINECEELNNKYGMDNLAELQKILKTFNMDDTSRENVCMYYILCKRKRTPTLIDNTTKRCNFKTLLTDNKKLFEYKNSFIIKNESYKTILDELDKLPNEEKQKIFVYLDPPYLSSKNLSRDDGLCSRQAFESDNMVYMFELMIKNKNNGLKIMLNIDNNDLYQYIFKLIDGSDNMIKTKYAKTYQITKRKTEHLIICNY